MTLIQRTIAGGVMVLMLVLFRRLTGKRLPKWSAVLLGDLTMLRLLIPLSIPSVWSVYSVLQRSQTVTERIPAPVVSVMPMEQLPVEHFTAITGGNAAVSGAESAVTALSLSQVMVFLWVAGMLLLGSAFLIAYVRSYRRFALSLPAEDPESFRWQKAHSLKRPYQIRISQEITSPLTYGVFRPVILLPKDMEPEALDYVLTHEWSHIRRWDTLRKMLLALTLTVHWFNPLVWVLYWLMNQDVELACDEAVLAYLRGDNRKDYALTLLSMEERQMGAMPLYSGFSRSGTEERVRAIMKNRKPTLLISLLALVLVAGLGVFFATSGMREKDAPPENTSSVVMDFLTAVYTTDYEGRFTALQAARDDATADMEAAMTAYMSGFEGMVTPELLEKMTAQRLPYKYDGLNSEEHPWTVGVINTSGNIETGVYDFRVEIVSVPEQAPITGQVTLDPETHLISNFWEGEISTVFVEIPHMDAPYGNITSVSPEKAVAINFLTALYTTDHNQRYSALADFLMNGSTASSSQNEALEIYMNEFEPRVTPDLMEQLWKNRIPYKYDERNQSTPWKVGGVALSDEDGNNVYEFSVIVMNKETFFVGSITGQVTIEPETLLVSKFWEGDISAEFEETDYLNFDPTVQIFDERFISAKGRDVFSTASQFDELEGAEFSCRFELDEEHPYFRVSVFVPQGEEHPMTATLMDEAGNILREEAFSDAVSFRNGEGEFDLPVGVYVFRVQSVKKSVPLKGSVKVQISQLLIEDVDDRAEMEQMDTATAKEGRSLVLDMDAEELAT